MAPLLVVDGICRSFGRMDVLRGVSLRVQPGELIGITGENGSGKSTLLQIIMGVQRADSGSITRSSSVGYCPQEALLFDLLSVEEHFACWAAGYGLSRPVWLERMENLLIQFRFGQHRKKLVAQLSGGTRQKLNLALALLHEPELLVLDEPYNGFDWETYLRFWDYANLLLQRRHRSILVVSHFISDKKRFSRIYNLQNGILT